MIDIQLYTIGIGIGKRASWTHNLLKSEKTDNQIQFAQDVSLCTQRSMLKFQHHGRITKLVKENLLKVERNGINDTLYHRIKQRCNSDLER